MADLLSPEWWGEHARAVPPVPPEGVLRDVLRDLFRAVRLPAAFQVGTGKGRGQHAVDADVQWMCSGA